MKNNNNLEALAKRNRKLMTAGTICQFLLPGTFIGTTLKGIVMVSIVKQILKTPEIEELIIDVSNLDMSRRSNDQIVNEAQDYINNFKEEHDKKKKSDDSSEEES